MFFSVLNEHIGPLKFDRCMTRTVREKFTMMLTWGRLPHALSQAVSLRRVHGVHKCVLANGKDTLQSRSNHVYQF